MIDPATVFLGRPIYSHTSPQHERGVNELLEDRAIGAQYDHVGESSVSTARDYVAHYFLTRTTCEWLVWVDADIAFNRTDWAYLMEEQSSELAVCAEYMKKSLDLAPEVAQFGLGFARVHRSVFEQLDELTTDEGIPRLMRYRSRVTINGQSTMEDFVEYHPIGVMPDGSRRQEDHGFWLMVRLAKIPIRIERRTRLGHTGPFTWWYDRDRHEAHKAKRGAQ